MHRHKGIPFNAGGVAASRVRVSNAGGPSKITPDTLHHHEPREGLVAVTCWCEKSVVKATASDVAVGLTMPCHREECIAMDEQNRNGLNGLEGEG